jgi:hypothetical protein
LVPGKQGEQSAAEAKPAIALKVPTGQGEQCSSTDVRGFVASPCLPLGHGEQLEAAPPLV